MPPTHLLRLQFEQDTAVCRHRVRPELFTIITVSICWGAKGKTNEARCTEDVQAVLEEHLQVCSANQHTALRRDAVDEFFEIVKDAEGTQRDLTNVYEEVNRCILQGADAIPTTCALQGYYLRGSWGSDGAAYHIRTASHRGTLHSDRRSPTAMSIYQQLP